MYVPRTYISKVSVTYLLCDESERRRDDELARILADPFLSEIAQAVDKSNAVHRALILRAVRDAANYRPSSA